MAVAETFEDRFHAVTGRLNATHAQLVDLTVEALADPPSWNTWECGSIEKFVEWQGGLQRNAAAKVVAIARRVDDLPLCIEAFRSGLLSLDQMAPIARRVPGWADEQICRQAQLMTVEQVSRTASKYPWDLDIVKPDGSGDTLQPEPQPEVDDEVADVDDAEDPVAASEPEDVLRLWWDDSQQLHLTGEFDAATGSIIENALTDSRDQLFHNGQQDLDWADALVETCQRSLDTIESPARRSRYRVHIDRETNGATTNANGCGITDTVADYISCDSLVSEVIEVDGTPISVGRSQHTVPERTRRTVIHRDGGCRVPGCGDSRWLDVHHIIHWAHGGPTDTPNLIALCQHHHRVHHQGTLGIIGSADAPDGVIFTNRYGQPIRQSGARPQPPGETPSIETPYKPARRERLEQRWQHFNPPQGFRPYYDHELQRTVCPRQHVG